MQCFEKIYIKNIWNLDTNLIKMWEWVEDYLVSLMFLILYIFIVYYLIDFVDNVLVGYSVLYERIILFT